MATAALIQLSLIIVPALASMCWGWFKRKDYINSSTEEALEAGVMFAWNTYGKPKKAELQAKFEDPEDETSHVKFSEKDQNELRSIAKTTAERVMAGKGLDLKSIMKSDLLQDLAINKIVKRFKNS